MDRKRGEKKGKGKKRKKEKKKEKKRLIKTLVKKFRLRYQLELLWEREFSLKPANKRLRDLIHGYLADTFN